MSYDNLEVRYYVDISTEIVVKICKEVEPLRTQSCFAIHDT